ncbi:hypothetical protein L7F22_054102 [Adiantum nelumboides]|nr:hypothetical protein [Adiantum nelumboides]
MEPAKEDESDSDEGRGSYAYSEAAFRVTIARLLWIYSLTAGVLALFCCIYLGVKMVVVWKVAMYSQALSPFDLSLLVGTDVGVLAVVVCLVFLVPRMIMTWITALVFEFVFERKLQRGNAVVENGKKLAREISIITIRNALKGGEIAAMVGAVATLVALTLVRSHVSDSTGTSVFPW